MSDKAFVCERCGKLKPMAYAGIREPEFCKCDAPTALARLMAENERLMAALRWCYGTAIGKLPATTHPSQYPTFKEYIQAAALKGEQK